MGFSATVVGPLIPRNAGVARRASAAVYEEKDEENEEEEEDKRAVSVEASARTRDRKLLSFFDFVFPPKARAPASEVRPMGMPLRCRADTFIVDAVAFAAAVAAAVRGCVPCGRSVASGLFQVERPDDSLT